MCLNKGRHPKTNKLMTLLEDCHTFASPPLSLFCNLAQTFTSLEIFVHLKYMKLLITWTNEWYTNNRGTVQGNETEQSYFEVMTMSDKD